MTPIASFLRVCAAAWFLLVLAGQGAAAAPCAASDDRQITGKQECLAMRIYQFAQAGSPPVLAIVLHGDGSDGGPSNYHYRVAEKLAKATPVVAVGLVRPGYEDGQGGKSSGNNNGRRDHYTQANIDEVAGAIASLRDRFKPRRIVLIGHSGGAATAAVILGRHPNLAQAAVLVGCPCDLADWRTGRTPWSNSESPHRWATKVPAGTKVIAVTGSNDSNTDPRLGRDYVGQLARAGIDAKFVLAPGAGHNDSFTSDQAFTAMVELVR